MILVKNDEEKKEEGIEYQKVLELAGLKILDPVEKSQHEYLSLEAQMQVVKAVRTFFENHPSEYLFNSRTHQIINVHDGEYSEFTLKALEKKVEESKKRYNDLWRKANLKVIK